MTKQIAKRGGSLFSGADPSVVKKQVLKMKHEVKEEIASELALVMGKEMANEIKKL